ncbi:MAG: UvrD-helicase domain-containing protein [Trueperaceae bacterium]
MSLTAQQAGAVRSVGSVAVTAGAGTGKTHMLTERYLHHLSNDGLRPLQIVAATFTERAAAELRGRIRARLRAAAEPSQFAAELEAAQIGTLHSLAGRICREHPEAAGVPYDFAVQDELQQRLWLDRNFRAALATLPPRLTRRVQFGTLSATLRALLADPYTAEQALGADPAAWPELIESERRRVFSRISAKDGWRSALAVLTGHSGSAGDKMEMQRSAAVAAVATLEAGQFAPEACRALDTLTRGRGSKSVWGEEALAQLKDACGHLRECYRAGKYVFELCLSAGDEALRRALPDVAEAYELVREYLDAAKSSERLLDFNDLELRALRALERPEVREFYARRWKAFLVDEFQDTNPVQAELLARLTGDRQMRLTVVGDEKQSIYGFRRADLTVFRDLRRSIASAGGDVIGLATSFRTHQALIEPINRVVAPALADLHQTLDGARTEAPGNGPFLSVHLVDAGSELKQFRQRAEAHLLGELIERILAEGTPVHDKRTDRLRPARAGDIAILTRTWNALAPYGDELAARGVPTIHAGGGNLLDQREAKDAVALLRFLADPGDDLALAAVLRSPFFAVADRSLLELAGEVRAGGSSWWAALTTKNVDPRGGGRHTDRSVNAPDAYRTVNRSVNASGTGRNELGAGPSAGPNAGRAPSEPGSLELAAASLATLLDRRPVEPPSRLLALADELTGYSAVIANLPGGPRRLADWRGVIEFVRQLEQGHADVFATVRDLRALATIDGAKVPRPGMEAGDAVSLMSVHNAKGLEWPIVILPDMTAGGSNHGADAVFDDDAGVAFKLRDEGGAEVEPALYTLLNERRKQKDADEELRVLYVAITRARDRVILTGSKESGGRLTSLAEGLAAAGVESNLIPFDPAAAVPKIPRPEAAAGDSERLLGATGPGLAELPVTSLSTYRVCPKRFRFEHIQQHPGAGEGSGVARRVGVLAHKALEREIDDQSALAAFDPTLAGDQVARALAFADAFRRSDAFEAVRDRIRERERQISLSVDGFLLHGVADAVGDDFVLDYKTGVRPEGDAHLLQVAIYARALARPLAYVAYLGEGAGSGGGAGHLQRFTAAHLERAAGTISAVLADIAAGDFAATPSPAKCGTCPFEAICDDSAAR